MRRDGRGRVARRRRADDEAREAQEHAAVRVPGERVRRRRRRARRLRERGRVRGAERALRPPPLLDRRRERDEVREVVAAIAQRGELPVVDDDRAALVDHEVRGPEVAVEQRERRLREAPREGRVDARRGDGVDERRGLGAQVVDAAGPDARPALGEEGLDEVRELDVHGHDRQRAAVERVEGAEERPVEPPERRGARGRVALPEGPAARRGEVLEHEAEVARRGAQRRRRAPRRPDRRRVEPPRERFVEEELARVPLLRRRDGQRRGRRRRPLGDQRPRLAAAPSQRDARDFPVLAGLHRLLAVHVLAVLDVAAVRGQPLARERRRRDRPDHRRHGLLQPVRPVAPEVEEHRG